MSVSDGLYCVLYARNPAGVRNHPSIEGQGVGCQSRPAICVPIMTGNTIWVLLKGLLVNEILGDSLGRSFYYYIDHRMLAPAQHLCGAAGN